VRGCSWWRVILFVVAALIAIGLSRRAAAPSVDSSEVV
jgi:hypothetical protein